MPKEVRQFVLSLQAELKVKKNNGKFSQQQTINHIVKEYRELTKQKP